MNGSNFNGVGSTSISDLTVNKFMAKVYGWMFLGLLVTAVSALVFLMSLPLMSGLIGNPIFFMGTVFAQFALVMGLSSCLLKISRKMASFLFLLYAALNGITLTYICLMYDIGTVVLAFTITAIIFASMSIYGHLTKADLTSFGSLATVGLIGVIVASIVNLFLNNPTMDYIICFVGLGIFIGLVAYDSQKIKTEFYSNVNVLGEEDASKTAIIGALRLYLDMINIFIFVLRLLGIRRD